MPSALIGEILKEGVRAVLISAAIELALLIIAFGIGMGVWFAKGFLSGLIAGFLAFAIGQVVVIIIIDMTHLFDDRPQESTRAQSDDEVIEELRKELEASNDQVETNKN